MSVKYAYFVDEITTSATGAGIGADNTGRMAERVAEATNKIEKKLTMIAENKEDGD